MAAMPATPSNTLFEVMAAPKHNANTGMIHCFKDAEFTCHAFYGSLKKRKVLSLIFDVVFVYFRFRFCH